MKVLKKSSKCPHVIVMAQIKAEGHELVSLAGN